jgi:hypothetical protein
MSGKIELRIMEIVILSIIFTGLAVYFNIYGEKHVLSFIINHVIALLIALLISKLLYQFIKKQ